MTVDRLRAPSTDGALLAVPPLDEALSLARDSTARLARWDHDFQGRQFDRLRRQVRREVTTEAVGFLRSHGIEPTGSADDTAGICVDRPLVVTGHQPEIFHPGVWVKNFATRGLASAWGGVGLNIIVDNDLPRSTSVKVPHLVPGEVRRIRVDFDTWKGEAPYEDFFVRDERRFADFPDRLRPLLGGIVEDPLLDDFWPRVLRRADPSTPMGLRFALARREIEGEWGTSNLEIPLSRVCRTEGFFWFASHLLAHLPRYREIHNEELLEYRRRHGIRSRSHPVAALGAEAGWVEAPFWAWRKGDPRRHALLARQSGKMMHLRIAGEPNVLAELPLAPDRDACCAVERLNELAGGPVRIRTRALTTTMFSRYLLGDLFLHGIGGAKYDELGDAISARFFGQEPPLFLATSMTLFVGAPLRPARPADLVELDWRLRDQLYNPDRHMIEPFDGEPRTMLRERARLIAQLPSTRPERVARSRAIRQINHALQRWVRPSRAELEERRDGLARDLQWNRVASHREYPLVIHSASRLREALGGLQARLEAPSPV